MKEVGGDENTERRKKDEKIKEYGNKNIMNFNIDGNKANSYRQTVKTGRMRTRRKEYRKIVRKLMKNYEKVDDEYCKIGKEKRLRSNI